MSDRDRIFEGDAQAGKPFRFNEQVVKVFPDMINRSVPGYGLIIELIGLLAHEFVRPETRVYDLGCSLGAATLAVRRAISEKGVSISAVDNSRAMVDRCSEIIRKDNSRVPVDVLLGNAEDIPIENASLVILNFTLQFLRPEERQTQIDRIHQGLVDGGALILSEKVRFEAVNENRAMNAWHRSFKSGHGYSDLEISRKRNALEKVMKTDSPAKHRARLNQAGFRETYDWFRCFNFISMVAIK